MTKEFISFAVDTSRVLELLAKQIYQSPLALLRENTQNAYDATLLRKALVAQYDPRIDVTVTQEYVSVKDNGIGMTAEDLERHFWRAGSSSKNTDEARRAGVVGTFGIGAMANFGIADTLEVVTESALTGQRTRCVARKSELRFNQDCIATENLPSQGVPGTEIKATIAPGIPIDVNAAGAYVTECVALLTTPVYFNNQLVSGLPVEQFVASIVPVWSIENASAQLSNRLTADVVMKASLNADITLMLTGIRWNGAVLHGSILLRSGSVSLRTFRSGFGLATVSVSSAYQFGGVADLQLLQPTAGREALTTDSMQVLQNLMADVDSYVSVALAARPEADSSSPFIQWVNSHKRYDLCGMLRMNVHPGDRTPLDEIRIRSQVVPMSVYDGSDQTVIASYSSEDRPLLIYSRQNPRKQCEIGYLNRFCKVEQVANVPVVNKVLPENAWTSGQAALVFRIKLILESDYFLNCEVQFGKISHGLALHVEFKGDVSWITLDPEGQTVMTILSLYKTEYTAFGSLVKDFVRNAIFPKVANKVPSSTRQGAEAFLRAIRLPREIFEYEEKETSSLSSIWLDLEEGKISLPEAISRSRSAVRNSVQVVESGSSG